MNLRIMSVVVLAAACDTPSEPAEQTPTPVEADLARALAVACPVSAPNDPHARRWCADRLAELTELRKVAVDPMLWGAQKDGSTPGTLIDESNLTEFNPRVWRKLYLSTFMFPGDYTVEVAGAYRVLRMPVFFRNMLDAGDYPYPFWHSDTKWSSYEQSTALLFLFKDGGLVAAARSQDRDPTRSHVEHEWDGNWMWSEGTQPHVTLFRYLFSTMNPHVERLEATYRDLEEGMRAENCLSCHSPDNSAHMKKLEMLSYPNQSLSGRHDIVRMLESNMMPPGIGVPDQDTRAELLRLARTFAEAGDDALEFEGEPAPAAAQF